MKLPDLTFHEGAEHKTTVFTVSMKRARKIRKFHVAVMQRRLKRVIHLQSCRFANIFAVLVAVAIVVA